MLLPLTTANHTASNEEDNGNNNSDKYAIDNQGYETTMANMITILTMNKMAIINTTSATTINK